jgi:hypothetical protein
MKASLVMNPCLKAVGFCVDVEIHQLIHLPACGDVSQVHIKVVALWSVGAVVLLPSLLPHIWVEKPMSAKVSLSMFTLQAWAGRVATPISAAIAKRLFLMLIPSFKGFWMV